MAKYRLVVACETQHGRAAINGALRTAHDIKVLAWSANLMETFSAVEETSPNIVLISSQMTRFKEFDVMRGLFESLNIRWLTVDTASGPRQRSGRAGASGLFPIDLTDSAESIQGAIRGLLTPRFAAPSPATSRKANHGYSGDTLILIGSSTGGVDALSQVLGGFPGNCPPTLIVQHTGQGFGHSLVRLLNRQCAADVMMATPGLSLTAGKICIAAGVAQQVSVTRNGAYQVRFDGEMPVSGHLPSVDHLFRSALPFAPHVRAAILTGMGNDGAEGLLQLRRAGARTIGQDQATSVVYGMPRQAYEIGAVARQLPLNKISDGLLSSHQPAT